MCELNHGQFSCRDVHSDDRYDGESDRVYKRRKAMEAQMAAYEPKAKPADPFAGFPQDEGPSW